jgi:hypothetical protein
MQILTDNESLNVFRFIGRTRYWEDNVTRGLMTLSGRSKTTSTFRRNPV